MTPEQLRELIREILEEQDIHAFHRRQTLVRFKDPDGRPWYSATISKVQAASAVFALLATIFGAIWVSMAARDEIVVYPRVSRMISASEADHIEFSDERYATKSEVGQVATALAVSKAERVEQFNAIQRQLDVQDKRLERIEAMLERLARR